MVCKAVDEINVLYTSDIRFFKAITLDLFYQFKYKIDKQIYLKF